jgi:hypothetical protein
LQRGNISALAESQNPGTSSAIAGQLLLLLLLLHIDT